MSGACPGHAWYVQRLTKYRGFTEISLGQLIARNIIPAT